MGKPRMIILIRHAQSEGNKNRAIHQTVPDHRVKLTQQGWEEAAEAGRRLRSMLRPDDSLQFFTSPYRRTRETTEGLLATLTSDDPSPSPVPRHKIKVYEEPRLREQDFGNFQPCSAEMERMWHERADYGHFFYRIPNGESAADAYDRISGFNESLWRQFGEDDCASVFVLVTHGLMTRVFLMKWYHFSVEYFEDLRNVNHCEFVIMNKNPDNGKYILENKLRTWSELQLERALAKGLSPSKIRNEAYIPMRKQWGGCPNGCDHGQASRETSSNNNHNNSNNKGGGAADIFDGRVVPASEEPDDPRGDSVQPPSALAPSSERHDSKHNRTSSLPSKPRPFFPSDNNNHHLHHQYLLHAGRDFGGSMSGVGSRAGSVASGDDSQEERKKKDGVDDDDDDDERQSTASSAAAAAAGATESATNPTENKDAEKEHVLDRMEAWDKSLQGSVF